MFTILWHMVWP